MISQILSSSPLHARHTAALAASPSNTVGEAAEGYASETPRRKGREKERERKAEAEATDKHSEKERESEREEGIESFS